MRNVYSVKQVNAYIKNMFTQDFMLKRIYVKGEVSNCKYHSSGHVYFSLKDESSTIACILFSTQRSGLKFRMADGQQIVVLGSITTYERDGKYQLYAKEIILDGVGLLYEKFEALKQELSEMGMFADVYKQAIPKFAQRIGIVTASTGAAIQDIRNVSARRNPFVQLVLYPAKVQGEGAAESIVRGIRALEKENVDLMIVGRGGGSIEDLWAFNEEIVARAIFDCTIPVISAVGHETDTTIADYVADLRAPTPSAAAELAVYDYRLFEENCKNQKYQLQKLMIQKIRENRMQLERRKWKIQMLHPATQLRQNRQLCVEYEERMRDAMQQKQNSARQKLILNIEKMKALSPLNKLNQGFSFVQKDVGLAVKSIQNVEKKDRLKIYVTDGVILASVEDKHEVDYGEESDSRRNI